MSEENNMNCEHCGKDDDILFGVHTRKDRDGNYYWVCSDCFKELEGVSYEDFRLSQKQS